MVIVWSAVMIIITYKTAGQKLGNWWSLILENGFKGVILTQIN